MASRRVVRKPLLSDQDKQDAMLLYLTHCRYENKYNKILLNGYNIKGETVGFVVENYQRYFFLQFHSTEMNSTQYPDRINSYLRWMERQARVIKAFHLPKQGDINHQQSQYNPIFNDKELPAGDKFHLISKWKTVDNQYKTMYGWTPDMLQNIIQVWVNEPKVCDAMCYFIESQEYILASQTKTPSYVVRIFEGQTMTDDLQFRADRGLVINQYCHVLMKPYYYSRYSSIDDSSYGDAITPIMYQEHEFHCDESCFYPLPPNTPTPPPLLRILSHDIEAAGKNFTNPYTNIKQSRFPVPLWRPKTIADAMEDQNKQFQIVLAATLRDHGSNSDEYRKLIPNRGLLEELMKEIKDTVGNPKKFKPWSNLSEWYENIHDKYQALEPYIVIPDPLDTDPAIMIVTALDIYNKPRTKPLHFPDSHAFVYTHPKMKKKIVKTRQVGASADINDEYEAMNLHTYSSELDMIAAFAEYIHECQPSIFTGWNIDNFDFPYLWERCQFYHIYFDEKYSEHGDTKCKANPFGTPNFGLLREIPCKYIEGKQFSTPSGVEDNSDPELKDDKKKTEYQNKNEFYIDEETGKKKKVSVAKKNPTRLSQAMATHIITPFVTHMDGIVVWRNPSFGVKSTMESKGSTPQFKLDNVSAIELKYPNTDRPRRKLEVSHSKTEELWINGGDDLWFFICYCYVDTTLPLFLLEKYAKVQLLFSIASICNCSMDLVYNNGMQSKIACLFYEQCRRLYDGKYLVPEWGRRGLHWPDVWLDANPYAASFRFAYLKPRPVGAKGYMGAWVMDPSRLLHTNPIFTNDFTSLYPSLSFSYEFDYNKFMTEISIKHYGIKTNEFVPQILGPEKIIFCGEIISDPEMAQFDQYRTHTLKTTFWKIQEEGIMSAIIKVLFDQRSYHKIQMAKWTYYNKFLSIKPHEYPTNDPAWDRNVLVPLSLKDKLGRFWDNMFKVAENLTTWTQEHERIIAECKANALPGETNFKSVTTTQTEVSNCGQLGFKLVLNSMYGFTTASLESATLPLLELGASITAQGRRIIRVTGSFSESLTVDYMKKELKQPSVWPFTFTAKLLPEKNVLPHEEMAETSRMLVYGDDLELNAQGQLVSKPSTLDDIIMTGKDDIKTLYEKYHRPDHFQLHGGDTDSVMIGHDRKYCEDGINLTLKMASLMVNTVNRFLRGCMGLTQEKTAIRSLFVDPKNYFMSVLNQKKLLCKGVEIVRGDIILFVNRILSKAADDLIHHLDVDHFEASFMRTFRYIQMELYRFVQGQINISELILHKKLAKVNYVNVPEHVKVAEKMRMRGERVEVGDFIEYVYARTSSLEQEKLRLKRLDRTDNLTFIKQKGGEVAESVNYVIQENIPLDLEHYWQSCIIKPVSKFFRHIIAPKIYPPVFETLTIQEQNKIQAFRQVVKNRQFQEVNTFLFEPLNKILLKRCEMDMRSANHIQTITSLITKSHTLECEYCNSFFDTLEPTQKICIACTKNYTDIVSTLKRKLKTVHQELEKNKAICHECVALTGFPLMDIETCTKYDCEIYETKSRLNIDKKQFEKKLEILSHITIEYEDSMQVDDEEEEEEKPQESKRFKPSTD